MICREHCLQKNLHKAHFVISYARSSGFLSSISFFRHFDSPVFRCFTQNMRIKVEGSLQYFPNNRNYRCSGAQHTHRSKSSCYIWYLEALHRCTSCGFPRCWRFSARQIVVHNFWYHCLISRRFWSALISVTRYWYRVSHAFNHAASRHSVFLLFLRLCHPFELMIVCFVCREIAVQQFLLMLLDIPTFVAYSLIALTRYRFTHLRATLATLGRERLPAPRRSAFFVRSREMAWSVDMDMGSRWASAFQAHATVLLEMLQVRWCFWLMINQWIFSMHRAFYCGSSHIRYVGLWHIGFFGVRDSELLTGSGALN